MLLSLRSSTWVCSLVRTHGMGEMRVRCTYTCAVDDAPISPASVTKPSATPAHIQFRWEIAMDQARAQTEHMFGTCVRVCACVFAPNIHMSIVQHVAGMVCVLKYFFPLRFFRVCVCEQQQQILRVRT